MAVQLHAIDVIISFSLCCCKVKVMVLRVLSSFLLLFLSTVLVLLSLPTVTHVGNVVAVYKCWSFDRYAFAFRNIQRVSKVLFNELRITLRTMLALTWSFLAMQWPFFSVRTLWAEATRICKSLSSYLAASCLWIQLLLWHLLLLRQGAANDLVLIQCCLLSCQRFWLCIVIGGQAACAQHL